MLFVREIGKILELWTIEVVEFFKQGLMSHPSRNTDSSSVEGDMDCGGPGQEFS